ncbi:MAG TPA: hypothetical protein VMN78_01150 [Longimicrobiales bacterium]|nr:hypothetical protein [Longimicrobiales bacterium]
MSTFVRPTWTGFGRAVLTGVLFTLFGTPTGASGQDAVAEKYERNRLRETPRAMFSLHASPVVVLDANQFQCGLRSQGDTCSDIFNSPTGGGGFWPTGSPNQYMFNSGIQIAGIIPEDAGFAWAGDTTGAFFMDARGTQQHGTPITQIFNSLDPDDIANWPSEGSVPGFPFATAFIRDASVFNTVLLDRAVGSQQDTWVMYWDGDPALSANRAHPMGVTIEQRTMAWNFPAGNEATIYIFYKITNVTDNEIFQQLNETRFNVDLPDEGWTYEDLFLAYDADPDVTTDAGENFSSAVLPFNMGITWHATFEAPEFSYPPSLFFPPFFTAAPGIIGVQYLKSPEDPTTGEEVGLTLFSVHTNTACTVGFCDPVGDRQLWRYISGNASPGKGDPACSFPDPQESRLCYLATSPLDVRFFQSSGPFELGAGESATIVVAMMAAATVATDELVIGAENPPGTPGLQPGCDDEILPIEIGAGWLSTPNQLCVDTPEGTPLDLRQINTVPLSLLGRAQVAQAVFDGQFLLPFAPEPPEFFLVPGDEEIAIIWAESASETIGDPFFETASQPTTPGGDPNPLFNPNYREFDVEGYRIYKSTDNSNFELIAQFDYATTTFTDVRCEADREFVPGEDTCPGDDVVLPINDVTVVDFIAQPFVLFGGPEAQRLRLSDGRTLAIQGDSATTGATPDLTDTGVPFAFIDTDVRNNFRYFYQVRAFDINSTFSGPISLESSSNTKNAIPQRAAPNQVLAGFTQTMQGADGEPLDPNAELPTIDPETGIFSGPMPPTNTVEATFAPLVPRLLPEFTLTARIDSVRPGPQADVACTNGTAQLIGTCWNMYMTFDLSGQITQSVAAGFTPVWDAFGGAGFTEFLLGQAPVEGDPASLQEFGAPEGFVSFNAALQGGFDESIWNSSFEGQQNRRQGVAGTPTGLTAGGSRWFNGAQNTTPDPARFIRVGHLEEADTVWAPIHNTDRGDGTQYGGAMQCFGYAISGLMRSVDLELTWTGGTVEVVDVTHNTPVMFKPSVQQNWGFVADGNGNGIVEWTDFHFIDGASQVLGPANPNLSFCGHPDDPAARTQLSATPVVGPVSTQGVGSGFTATGTGFGLYINADRFIFELPGGALPPDGTVWTLRSYHGVIQSDNAATADPSGYVFIASRGGSAGITQARPPMVPGLEVVFESLDRTQLVGTPDLRLVHTVPDPYYTQSRFDLSPVEKALRFVNLPAQATIRIYTVSGLLVDVVNHDDPAGGGMETWDLKNRSGQFVASGVYFYHVSTPDGQEHIGRFTVINSGIGQ